MKEAEDIIEMFYKHHVIITKNSKGNPTSPYKSGFIQDEVMKYQAKQFALIYVEEKYKALREQLFNLRACKVIKNERTYLVRVDNLIREEATLKQAINNK